MSVDAIYQNQIKILPIIERLRLARLIVDELAESAPDAFEPIAPRARHLVQQACDAIAATLARVFVLPPASRLLHHFWLLFKPQCDKILNVESIERWPKPHGLKYAGVTARFIVCQVPF